MDEDISIINSNTRNERIKNFFLSNKKKLVTFFFIFILIIILFFGYGEIKKSQKKNISLTYNSIILDYNKNEKTKTTEELIAIINKKDPTYSPLSLYFIIDNKLISNKEEINLLFNVIIEKISLEKEIRNLIIYKKALYNADLANENELLEILNPLINSDSVWKSHALYLIGEFFYSKNEKEKSKEFFNNIVLLENPNLEILRETQKRLNRDLSD